MSPTATAFTLAAMLPIAFAIGSVPFGLLIGKARGIDVRTLGSGNIGATNVGRAMGKQYFFFVLLLDALKAAVPAGAASLLVHLNTTPLERGPVLFGLWISVGVAAMLGHIFSPFLKFKGGKGVACGLGLVFGTFPYLTAPGVVGLSIFVITFKLSRYISLGSVLAAASLPISYLIFAFVFKWNLATQWPGVLLLTLIAALVIWRHRENIRRLIAGSEHAA